jgi:hypothetical protein
MAYNPDMATIRILKEKTTHQQILEMLEAFPDMRMIKVVVDIENNILAGGSGMHYECEQLLLEKGSFQENLWVQTGFQMNKTSNSRRLSTYAHVKTEA